MGGQAMVEQGATTIGILRGKLDDLIRIGRRIVLHISVNYEP
jgi:hypothetical protein